MTSHRRTSVRPTSPGPDVRLPAPGDVQVASCSAAVDAYREAAEHCRWLAAAIRSHLRTGEHRRAAMFELRLEVAELGLIGLWTVAAADAPLQAEHARLSVFGDDA